MLFGTADSPVTGMAIAPYCTGIFSALYFSKQTWRILSLAIDLFDISGTLY